MTQTNICTAMTRAFGKLPVSSTALRITAVTFVHSTHSGLQDDLASLMNHTVYTAFGEYNFTKKTRKSVLANSYNNSSNQQSNASFQFLPEEQA